MLAKNAKENNNDDNMKKLEKAANRRELLHMNSETIDLIFF
jgi:hypothetical protein